MYLGLADVYDAIVGTASSDKLVISVVALNSSQAVSTYTPVATNIASLYSVGGVYDISNV